MRRDWARLRRVRFSCRSTGCRCSSGIFGSSRKGRNRMRRSILWLAAIASLAIAAKKATDDTSNPAYKDTPVSVAPNTTGKPAPPVGFLHPGILVNRGQLNEIKRRVEKGIEPQKSAFEALKASKWGARDYMPHPRATVECGSQSNPDYGCKDEQADSEAA